jgi:hypothetical protein
MSTKTITLEARLVQVIDEALELADLGGRRTPATDIAKRLKSSEIELIDELREIWVLARLTWMVSRRRNQRWADKNAWAQLRLPEFPDEPKRIWLPTGEREKLDYCSVKQVDAHIRLLKTRYADPARIRRMEMVAEIMRRYSPDKPGITWEEVKRREIERRDAE